MRDVLKGLLNFMSMTERPAILMSPAIADAEGRFVFGRGNRRIPRSFLLFSKLTDRREVPWFARSDELFMGRAPRVYFYDDSDRN